MASPECHEFDFILLSVLLPCIRPFFLQDSNDNIKCKLQKHCAKHENMEAAADDTH